MKIKTLLLAALSFVSMAAFAQEGVSASADLHNKNAALSGSEASNKGNEQSINFNSPDKVKYEGGYTIKSAPPVAAPGLTTTLSETCMGSSSLGVSVIGFGISGGTTWVDSRCARRLDSRDLRAMGYKTTACELMKMTDEVAEAFKRSGDTCLTAVQAVPATAQPAAAPDVVVTPVTE